MDWLCETLMTPSHRRSYLIWSNASLSLFICHIYSLLGFSEWVWLYACLYVCAFVSAWRRVWYPAAKESITISLWQHRTIEVKWINTALCFCLSHLHGNALTDKSIPGYICAIVFVQQFLCSTTPLNLLNTCLSCYKVMRIFHLHP